MLTLPEFLASLQREAAITKHLVSKLDAGHLDHRLTEKQRSLGELIEYLAIQLEGCVSYFVTGSWDRWEALEKEVAGLTPSAFPAAMDRQMAAVERLLAGADLTKPVPLPPGGEAPLGVALLEFTLKFAVTYKVQLFLQAKHAGLGELNSKNLWRGSDT
jgi:hypothetical protein